MSYINILIQIKNAQDNKCVQDNAHTQREMKIQIIDKLYFLL